MTEQMVIEHIGHLAGDYKCWDNTITREESLILCNLLEELEQYRALGTVEELRVARDKQIEEFCEWKTEKDLFIQNPHTKRKFSNEPSMKNTYCNTCGKKIKVV